MTISTIRTLMMTAGIAALAAGGAVAQETTSGADASAVAETQMTDTTEAPFEYQSLEEMTVGDMIGQKVYDPEGTKIGDIDYIIPDGDGAQVVIGIGGFLGLGEYTVALPLGDFSYDAEQNMLQLDTDKETLKAQPEFDESGAESLPDDIRIADLLESTDPAETDGVVDDGAAKEEGMTDEPATDEGAAEEAPADNGTVDAPATDEGAMEEAPTDDATGDTDSESKD